ncbi:MAG: hypothetical protein EXX96DRAFT_476512 [Benjaminiella poitrasii]|nr:MAG: hypothetical protein EXX96DRAFT_476512 [Benjaminiella poitrasii]
MTSLQTVYAIHDFEAENNDELDFHSGEPVIVLQKDDGFDDGWWKGKNTKGEIGLFPMNFITFEKPARQSSELPPTPSTSDLDNDIKTNSITVDRQDSPISIRSSFSFSGPVNSNTLRRLVINASFLPALRSTPPEEWSVDQVEVWLKAMNFGSIETNFKLQEITGDVLLELNMNSLKELDIPTFGKRFKLYTAIDMLREEYGYPSSRRMSEDFAGSTDHSQKQKKGRFKSTTTDSRPIISAKSSKNILVNHRPPSSSSIHQLQNHPVDSTMTRSSSMEFYYSTHHNDHDSTNATPDMEGWLHKQGCKYKKWNKRWFVLKGPNLFYFKSPKDVRMKGIINLRGYKIIPDETIQPGKYCFKAQHDKERTFYFYTDLDTSLRAWIACLMKATISRDLNIPVLSSSVIPTVSLDVARRMRPRPPSALLYYQHPHEQGHESDTGSSCKTTNEYYYDDEYEASFHTSTGSDDSSSERSSLYNSFSSSYASLSSWNATEYIQWVNTISRSGKISRLKDLRQGDILIEILEELSGKKVKQLPPSSVGSVSMLMLDNMVAVFKFMSMENIDTEDQFSIKDILDGNEENIMLMLQSILKWSIRSKSTA